MDVLLRVLLFFSALTGIQGITTVSKVPVKAGGSITIPCLYRSQYKTNWKYLCKGYYWNYCSYAVETKQKTSSGRFSISDDKNQNIFTVTIKDLTTEDTDYWCAVEINGGADERMYFLLSVTTNTPSLYTANQEITGSTGGEITIQCNNGNSGEMKWCRLGGSCVTKSGSIAGTTVTISGDNPGVLTVTMSGLKTESSGWYMCVKGDLQMPVHITVTEKPTTSKDDTTGLDESNSDSSKLMAYIIPLSLLTFIVLVTVFIWFMLKRHMQIKEAASTTTVVEDEVTYSTIQHKTKTSSQDPSPSPSRLSHCHPKSISSHKKSPTESADDMTYSSVKTTKQQHVPRVEA